MVESRNLGGPNYQSFFSVNLDRCFITDTREQSNDDDTHDFVSNTTLAGATPTPEGDPSVRHESRRVHGKSRELVQCVLGSHCRYACSLVGISF